MKKTTTLLRLLVLIFSSAIFASTAVAQQATDARTTKTASKSIAPTVQAKGNKQASDLPYYNYKGITDKELAKVTWKKDNPEAYRKWVQGNKATSSPNK